MTIDEAQEKGYWSAAFNSEEIEDFQTSFASFSLPEDQELLAKESQGVELKQKFKVPWYKPRPDNES